MSKTHYEVLGVNELAGGAKIKRHYYELCKKFHPDVIGGDPQKMVAINEAYRILSDPTLKSGYDRGLAAERRESAFAQTAQHATAQQTARAARQRAASQPEEEPAVFRHATHTAAVKKKHSGMAWFISLSGVVAVALIAVSYLAPFPKAATASNTSDTPSVATTESTGDTDSGSSASQTNSSTTDAASQAALNTLQSDTPDTTTPTTGSDSGTSGGSTPPSTSQQTQPAHKHRHPISFWYPQNND